MRTESEMTYEKENTYIVVDEDDDAYTITATSPKEALEKYGAVRANQTEAGEIDVHLVERTFRFRMKLETKWSFQSTDPEPTIRVLGSGKEET